MASATGASADGSTSDCEGEDQDESSSSSPSNELAQTREALENLNVNDNQKKDNEDELAAFRQQWQRELGATPSPQREPPPVPARQDSVQVTEAQTEEEKAKQLFLRGVEMERGGKLYEAVQHYKRAMQILPDVEARLYESSDLRGDTPEVESETEEAQEYDDIVIIEEEDVVEGEDLLTRLQRIVAKRGFMCEPAYPPKEAHISWLPYEVLLLILRWVVSAELDAASLERVAATCRGFYVAARQPHVWRALCVKTWGIECGTPRANGFLTWRQMFVDRPRVNLHGCYISKTTYLRHGENSFQDQFYRPWYLIDYYRYLRFFPEGIVLMWTTAEEPALCVGHLKYRTAKGSLGIMGGHYRLMGNKVVVVIKKTQSEKKQAQMSNTRFRARRKDSHDVHEQTFHLELELRNVRSRRNFQLVWTGYSVCTRRDQWTQFELSPSKFPPFAFSRVRAYTADALAPLAPTHAYT